MYQQFGSWVWRGILGWGLRCAYMHFLPCPYPSLLQRQHALKAALYPDGFTWQSFWRWSRIRTGKAPLFLFTFTRCSTVRPHYRLSVCCSVISNCLWPHGLQHTRLPRPSLFPGAYSNSCPLSQWCHPTILFSVAPHSPALSLSQHQGLFQWVSSSHQVATVLELQLQRQSFQWIFRVDFL